MDLASIPSFLPIPFASGAGTGYINTVPQTSSPTPGLASYTTGFVPANFEPIASGGTPPSGGDFNGLFFDITTRVRWAQAGGGYPYDSAFSTAIGGYPKGALVLRADSTGQWLSTVDNNTTDPDSSGASGWVAMRANTGSAAITATSGTVSPTKTQLGAQVLIVSGTLTANAKLQLPLTAGAQWTVVNNTTGSFTLTVGGATGTTATVTQGTGIIAYTDGTNYYAISAAVSGAYLPIDGTAVAATKLATARTFSITGGVTAAGVSFDGTGNVALNVTAIPGNAATSSKWASTITLSLTGIATGSASIDGSGNVTLSTSIADGALSIAKTSGLQTAIDGKVSKSGDTISGVLAINQLGASGYALSISGSTLAGAGVLLTGNGATSPSKTIAVRSGSLQVINSAGSTTIFSIDDSGNSSLTGSVTASGGFQTCDRRLKKNIKPREVQRGFALKLARMFCEWDRIADGVHDVGLVAQRVKALASRYVKRSEDKRGILAIDKAGIALEAAMDCALQLDEQAKTIRALLRRIEKLEKAR